MYDYWVLGPLGDYDHAILVSSSGPHFFILGMWLGCGTSPRYLGFLGRVNPGASYNEGRAEQS